MERCEGPARSVVVDDQVVDSYDLRMCHDDLVHLIDCLPVRRLAEKRADGLLYEHDARVQYEQGNYTSHVAVQIHSGEFVDEHSDDYDYTRNHIVSVVRSGGYYRKRFDMPARRDGKQCLRSFQQYREKHERDHEP